MYIVRLSLFCVAALLVNGAYAKDFSDTAGASAKTAEFTVSTPQVRDYRVGTLQDEAGELRQQTSRGLHDDGQWVRISDPAETETGNREPRPADSTPRWVF